MGSGEDSGWPLTRIFVFVAVVLVGIVVLRAVGSILSALEVPSLNPHFGAHLPNYLRLRYGTFWADLPDGLVLLTALGFLAVPRMVWEVPSEDHWAVATPKLVVGVLVVSGIATIAAGVGVANEIWHSEQVISVGMNVADGVAAMALTSLVCALSWFAVPFSAASATDQHLLRPSAEEGPSA